MRVLRPGVDLGRFFEDVSRTRTRALLFDYDGTLAPFEVRRDRAFPFPEVWAIVARIARAGRTRVALVSGRSARNLERLVGDSDGIELFGSYGAERLKNGGACRVHPPPEGAARFLEVAEAWVAQRGWSPFLERKPFGLALHGRGEDPAAFAALEALVLKSLTPAAEEAGCEFIRFDGGIELRPVTHRKEHVVDAVASEAGPGSVLAYLGDDVTDEEAFRALRGRGIGVLVRDRERPTSADLWIRPPEELLWFLDQWEKAEKGATVEKEARR